MKPTLNEKELDKTSPLEDWIFENDYINSSEQFRELLKAEQENDSSFWFEPIVFVPDKKAVVITGHKEESEYVYESEEDGTIYRYEPRKWLNKIVERDDLREWFQKNPEDKFNKDFWEYPPLVYHGTDNLKGVLKSGLEPRSETRGINNRSVGAAVFTTQDLELAKDYSYGPDGGVVIINTKQMKQDGFTPFVSQEPEILENELLGALAHRIGLGDYFPEESSDMVTPDTVIFYKLIPAKYLSEYQKGIGEAKKMSVIKMSANQLKEQISIFVNEAVELKEAIDLVEGNEKAMAEALAEAKELEEKYTGFKKLTDKLKKQGKSEDSAKAIAATVTKNKHTKKATKTHQKSDTPAKRKANK
jgi:hypothetical protein